VPTTAKYFKVKIPRKWLRIVIDPNTFDEIFVKVDIPHGLGLKYIDLPPFMIQPKSGGHFMFEDEMEALTFKLTYL
jgi:hypothetical protein